MRSSSGRLSMPSVV